VEKFVCHERLPFTLTFMLLGGTQFEFTTFCIHEMGSKKFQENFILINLTCMSFVLVPSHITLKSVCLRNLYILAEHGCVMFRNSNACTIKSLFLCCDMILPLDYYSLP
jgi:hypothetical protein